MIARCPRCLSSDLVIKNLSEDYTAGHTLDGVNLIYYCHECDADLNTNLNVSLFKEDNLPSYIKPLDKILEKRVF